MNSITSIEQLITTLDDCDPSDYIKIANSMRIPLSQFNTYATWKEDGYARNCIERTDKYELVLLCWNEGDKTPIHGHDNQKCWVYQVDGSTSEIRYKEKPCGTLEECNKMDLSTGKLSFMVDDMGYHSLENNSKGRSMTLHLYISPIDKCKVFDDCDENFVLKSMKYDTLRGQKIDYVINN
jgi:cysteine dioxygenase